LGWRQTPNTALSTPALGRWDSVHSDRINALALATNTPYFGTLNSTRNRFTPRMQFLIHPNIKASFEYQFRPSRR
jgi:hypothetical protein